MSHEGWGNLPQSHMGRAHLAMDPWPIFLCNIPHFGPVFISHFLTQGYVCRNRYGVDARGRYTR